MKNVRFGSRNTCQFWEGIIFLDILGMTVFTRHGIEISLKGFGVWGGSSGWVIEQLPFLSDIEHHVSLVNKRD